MCFEVVCERTTHSAFTGQVPGRLLLLQQASQLFRSLCEITMLVYKFLDNLEYVLSQKTRPSVSMVHLSDSL